MFEVIRLPVFVLLALFCVVYSSVIFALREWKTRKLRQFKVEKMNCFKGCYFSCLNLVPVNVLREFNLCCFCDDFIGVGDECHIYLFVCISVGATGPISMKESSGYLRHFCSQRLCYFQLQENVDSLGVRSSLMRQ